MISKIEKKVYVTEVTMDLGVILDGGSRETERVNGPFKVCIPFAPTKRTPLSQGRFCVKKIDRSYTIDLNDGNTSFFKIRNFIAQS